MRKRNDPKAPAEGGETDRQFVTSLQRGLDVLQAFRPGDRAGLSNRELAERTGLPNSTISRLTYTLLNLGYLVYDEGTGRYRMGLPVLSLGYACLGGMQIVDAAQPYMQKLADECGDGVLVALGGRDANAMTYLATARSVGVISLQLNVGSRISLGRSAMGRAYLAAIDDDERAEILPQLEAHYGPDKWPGILKGIEDARDQIANRGFYANIKDWQSDVHSIAVPYRSPRRDTPPLSFNLGGPAFVLPEDRLINELGPKLVELVNLVSRAGH